MSAKRSVSVVRGMEAHHGRPLASCTHCMAVAASLKMDSTVWGSAADVATRSLKFDAPGGIKLLSASQVFLLLLPSSSVIKLLGVWKGGGTRGSAVPTGEVACFSRGSKFMLHELLLLLLLLLLLKVCTPCTLELLCLCLTHGMLLGPRSKLLQGLQGAK